MTSGRPSAVLTPDQCNEVWSKAVPTGDTLAQANAAPYIVNFAQVDTDNDGTIDKKEFEAACAKGLVLKTEERRRQGEPMVNTKRTMRDALERWIDALIDQNKQTTRAARHRAHARVTGMEDLIAETPTDDIEGVGIKLALNVYMSGVDGRQRGRTSVVSIQGLRSRYRS
jgi:hypothetical protein